MPKISVIIPTFNRGEMVVKCVQSVLATNYPELEIIGKLTSRIFSTIISYTQFSFML